MKQYKIFGMYLTILEIVFYIIIMPGAAIAAIYWLYQQGYLTKFWNWIKDLFKKNNSTTTSSGGPKIIVSDSKEPRGIRNKNPLNIMYNSANDWKGQIGSDGTFCVFSEMSYGCRAALKLLQNYIKGGTNTISSILLRWAPDGGSAYTNQVCLDSGIMRDKVLSSTDRESIVKIAYAMHKFENGGTFLTYQDFDNAWNLI